MEGIEPAQRPQRVLQLTDLHLRDPSDRPLMGVNTESSFLQTLGKALGEGLTPDLLLLTGDLAEDPTPECYRRLQAHLKKQPFPSLCIPGNHDDPETMADSLLSGQNGIHTQYELGHWALIGLNSVMPGSPSGHLSETEMNLLRLRIERTVEPHVLIVLHHHPIECGSPWMDRMRLTNAEPLMTLIKSSNKIRGVVFGHIHQELDEHIGSVRFLGSPSTCIQFAPGANSFCIDQRKTGYRWLNLHSGGDIETVVHRALDLEDQVNREKNLDT